MWVEWSVKNGENKYRAPIHSVWLQNHGGFLSNPRDFINMNKNFKGSSF